jgi:hypothetical protein
LISRVQLNGVYIITLANTADSTEAHEKDLTLNQTTFYNLILDAKDLKNNGDCPPI